MSASLESLLRDTLVDDRPASRWPGVVSFLAIGGGAALVFVAVSSLAIAALPMLPSWMVSAACYAACIVPVYLLHRRFSFRSGAPHGRALPRYVLVQLSALALATIFSYVAYGIIGLPTPLAALLVTGLTSGVNFVVLRSWAFA